MIALLIALMLFYLQGKCCLTNRYIQLEFLFRIMLTVRSLSIPGNYCFLRNKKGRIYCGTCISNFVCSNILYSSSPIVCFTGTPLCHCVKEEGVKM